MDDVDTNARESAAGYLCGACSRRFIDLGSSGSDELVCRCGAALSPQPLPRGLHELGAAVPVRQDAVRRARSSTTPKEPDQGYGASHGYDVTHGGPSGPGDAPAEVPEENR
jgi:hypothetical protein